MTGLAQTPEPITQPFRINTTDEDQQFPGSVAHSANGDFVVVWASELDSLSQTSIRAQRIRVDGTPVGDEILIDVDTLADTSPPRVAMDAAGNFVVTWDQGPNFVPEGDRDIKLRRYDASGSPLGSEMMVNSFFTGHQRSPSVDMHHSGAFVVVWSSEGSDGEILGQRFDSTGLPTGSAIEIVPESSDLHGDARVAMDATGDFVVAWRRFPTGVGTSVAQIEARRFSSNGQPLEAAFQVSFPGMYNQNSLDLDRSDDGQFAITWSAYAGQPNGNEVFARRFDASSVPLGDAFTVNSFTTSYQVRPDIAMDDDGSFQVVWLTDSGNFEPNVSGQRFRSDGSRQGDEWRVNIEAINRKTLPHISSASANNFLVTWNSQRPGDDVRGRLFRIGIFLDGFESGNTAAWSTSTP